MAANKEVVFVDTDIEKETEWEDLTEGLSYNASTTLQVVTCLIQAIPIQSTVLANCDWGQALILLAEGYAMALNRDFGWNESRKHQYTKIWQDAIARYWEVRPQENKLAEGKPPLPKLTATGRQTFERKYNIKLPVEGGDEEVAQLNISNLNL